MDIKPAIKEEPKDSDTDLLEFKQIEIQEENSYVPVNDSELKWEEEFERDSERIIKIKELNLQTSDAGPIKEHLSSCSKNPSSTSFIEVTQDIKDNTKKQIFPCKFSDHTLTTTPPINKHILINEYKINNVMHDGQNPYKCEVCGKSFAEASALKLHLKIHEDKKPHMCDVCGKSFTRGFNLSTHLFIHEGKKPHKCEVCGKNFTFKCNLKTHLLVHEDKKPYRCELCEKSFTQALKLKEHLMIHEGKKPHNCEYCGRCFTRVSNFRHLLIHEGKKPHRCEFCWKSFTHKSNLKKHLLIH